jgi:hypothetical protein
MVWLLKNLVDLHTTLQIISISLYKVVELGFPKKFFNLRFSVKACVHFCDNP